MDIESEILDRELDTIFYDCPRDRNDNARVQNLIDACVEKYADGQPEIKNILLQRMDPNKSNPLISRRVFKSKVKEWMMAASGNYSEVFSGSPEENAFSHMYERPASTSTPLRNPLTPFRSTKLHYSNLGTECDFSSPACTNNSIRELNAVKEKNESLENSLLKAEQRVHSLEIKLTKQKADMSKKIQSFEMENHRLSSILTELQEKCLTLEENCDKYKLNNDKLVAEGEKLKELEKKNEDLEIKFLHATEELKQKNSDMRNMESHLYRLNIELRETRESKETIEKELRTFKADMNAMLYNQKELNNRIAALQCEKKELLCELSDARDLEQLYTLGEDDNYSTFTQKEDKRESGISIKSEMTDALVCGSCSQIFQNNNSSPSFTTTISPTNDKSTCVLSLLNSSRRITEDTGMQTIFVPIASCCEACQTDDVLISPMSSRIFTEDIGVQTSNLTTKLRIFTEDIGVQTLNLTTKLSWDSKECQTTDVLTNPSLLRMDSKETQTIDFSSSKSSHSEENDTQTTNEETTTDSWLSCRHGAGDTDTADLINSTKNANISSVLRSQVLNFRQANFNSLSRIPVPTNLVFRGHKSQKIRPNRTRRWYAALSLFLLVAVVLLVIWMNNDCEGNCRPHLRYPRGPPPS